MTLEAGSGGSNSTNLIFKTASSGTESEAMRIDSSGLVGIGVVPSGTAKLQVAGQIYTTSDGTASAPTFAVNDGDTGMFRVGNNTLGFTTGGTERVRIDSSGSVMFQTTDHDAGVSTSSGSTQFSFRSVDGLRASTSGTHYFNKFNDGTIIIFRGQGTDEGNISISGTTISYNGGHLARWSQATDGNRIDGLVKGTVMTNLDQMAVWHHEAQPATYYEEGDELPEGVSVGDEKTPAVAAYDEDNEQLNCMAVSSVEGDANVAGVFVNWDDDDTDFTADMNIAMTGDMVIRIASGTTVARGDLLMSAGDGTAKPQGDDIVRSKTIAKVTSTTVSHTYDDGSYLVPCVLMAC
jgi:hypothetical protein